MDKDDFLASIESDSEKLLSAAASVPQNNPIAVCPGWTMRDLVAHQGWVWGNATANVAAANPEQHTPPANPEPPEDPSKLFDWVASVRTAMLEALAAAHPTDPCWTFAPHNQTASFWQRRMTHETMLHRWDAQSAALNIDPLYPDIAADGIDEYLEIGLQNSPRRSDRTYPSQSLHLHCTDTVGEWTIVGDDGPNVTVTKEHAKGDAAVRGQAEEVLLWVWGRPGQVEIFGDEEVAKTWQALAP